MFFRTSTLLALACAACSAPRPEPAATHGPASSADPHAVEQASEQPESPAAAASQPPASTASGAQPTAEPVSSEPARASEPATPQRPLSDAERELQQRVIRAMEAGNYEEADNLLSDWRTAPLLAEARMLLDRGRPEEAMAVTQRAVDAAPGDPRVALYHGEASLRAGLHSGDKSRIETAQRAFGQAGTTSVALLGASHAARELGRVDEALRLAREGWTARQTAGAANDTGLPPCELAELTVAHALVDAYEQERRALNASTAPDNNAPPAGDSALFGETEAALQRLVERAPTDPWGWQSLGALYEGAARLGDAQNTWQRGASALPGDEAIGSALARVAHERGGDAAVIAAFEALQRVHPESPLPWWFAGRARFDQCVAAYSAQPAQCAEQAGAFQATENEFRKCAERGGTHLGNPAQFQGMCRSAAGLCALQADRLEDALASFRSIDNKLYTGALDDEPSKVLPSGVRGIELVAEAYRRRDDQPHAAELFVDLHVHAPRKLDWAMRAGKVSEDAGDQLLNIARDCDKVAQGKITDARRIQELRERLKIKPEITGDAALREELRKKGESRFNAAYQRFNTSYACYRDATLLAPDDVRALRECAKVTVEHSPDHSDGEVKRRIEEAQSLLQRCIQLGKQAVASAGATEEQRLALADAYETRGKLLFDFRNDPARAKESFELCLETSPTPRPGIVDTWLPKCVRALEKK